MSIKHSTSDKQTWSCSDDHSVPPVPPWATPADALLWDIDGGDGYDRRVRRPIFKKFSQEEALSFAKQFRKTFESRGRAAATAELIERTGYQPRSRVPLTRAESAIGAAAKARAAECESIGLQYPGDLHRQYEALATYVEEAGFEMPSVRGDVTLQGAILRMMGQRWWRGKLRVKTYRHDEAKAIRQGQVHQGVSPYVSEAAIIRRRLQRLSNRDLLERMEACNELDQSYTLAELSDLGVSNPRNRRAELMARIEGLEAIATELGHVALFITVTCPSRMHARIKATGARNPNYDGTLPDQANIYLGKVGARVRSQLKRLGIQPYGSRIAEPNHDGTPHHHFLLFVEERNVGALVSTFRHYALQADPNERGADKHRVTVKRIEPEKGTATGYVAKYISKNVDGFGLNADLLGNPIATVVERVEAWRSLWGIHQFQQIGGPPVGPYRELRRVEEPIVGDDTFEAARLAADGGMWAGYVRAQGGVHMANKDRPVHLLKVRSDEPGLYGESKSAKVIGVRCGIINIQTRVHTWTIELNALDTLFERPPIYLERIESGNSESMDAGTVPPWLDKNIGTNGLNPWSSVNNCTEANKPRENTGIDTAPTSLGLPE